MEKETSITPAPPARDPWGDRTIPVGKVMAKGAEHRVYEGDGIVHKVPRRLARLWQGVSSEQAQEDLDLLKRYDLPIATTVVRESTRIETASGVRKKVAYVLGQVRLEGVHEVRFADLFHFEDRRRQVIEIVRKADALFREKRRAVDLLGFAALADVPPVFMPWRRKIYAALYNAFTAEHDVSAERDVPVLGIKEGQRIIGQDEVQLCDARLLDCRERKWWHRPGLHQLLKADRDFQSGTMWTVLKYFGIKPEIEFDTRALRLARWVTSKALPKMVAGAQACGA